MQHLVLIQNWMVTTAAVDNSTMAKVGIDSGDPRPLNGLLCLLLWFHIAESLSCEAPKRALVQTGTELHGCSEHEAETGC